jgi:hypothetical protein
VNDRPADRLADMFRARSDGRYKPVDLAPATAHEAVTRQMVVDLAREIGDLRRRIDALFYLVISAILVDLLGRIFGVGLS